jgi:hypothetical protein
VVIALLGKAGILPIPPFTLYFFNEVGLNIKLLVAKQAAAGLYPIASTIVTLLLCFNAFACSEDKTEYLGFHNHHPSCTDTQYFYHEAVFDSEFHY